MSILLLLASIACSSLSQYWQKRAALLFVAQPHMSPGKKLLAKPLLLGVVFLVLGAVCWLGVLSQWEVSLAYPLLSSNFVIMLLVSKFIFKEPVNLRQWFGVSLIVLGVAILGGVGQWL